MAAAWASCSHRCLRHRAAVFDLSNLWLEQQQRQEVQPEQQAALAALVWRRPLAADFLRCMVANLPWAAQFVATNPLRPEWLPPSLDGRFSFTAEVRAQPGMLLAAWISTALRCIEDLHAYVHVNALRRPPLSHASLSPPATASSSAAV